MGIPALYLSTDSGAPVINNGAGQGVGLLDAVLVTGYPTQSITGITRSGTVATVNKTAHGYSNGAVISISGANEDAYNGLITITGITDANNFTYTVAGSPATPATGTILASTAGGKAGRGWQLVYTGTNKRVYRPRSGARLYLRADNATNVYTIILTGYETMTDIDTGTGAFGPAYWPITDNVASARAWFINADEKRIFFIVTNRNASSCRAGFYFGDFASYKAGDAFNVALIGEATNVFVGQGSPFTTLTQTPAGTSGGHFLAKSYTGLGNGVASGKGVDVNRHSNVNMGVGTPGTDTLAYPYQIDGTIHLSRMYVKESGIGLRGHIQGLWAPCHNHASLAASGVGDGNTFSGGAGLSGREFLYRNISAATLITLTAAVVIETTDWDS